MGLCVCLCQGARVLRRRGGIGALGTLWWVWYDEVVLRGLALCFCLSVGVAPALAERGRPTPLLEADLQTGRRVRIDASSGELDAEFDRVLGADSGFSTRELELVLERLRAELRRERPRATPRLVVFLYPGAVALERLKALPQIFVDIEIVLDPCGPSVCREAAAKHIEMVGRAVERPVLITPSHRFVLKTLLLSTSERQGEAALHLVPIADCIAAARPGGGLAWLTARERAEQDYEPLAVRAIAQKAQWRRVALTAPPRVRRDGAAVHALVRAHGDRGRLEQQVIDALAVALLGLRMSPATPKDLELEVELEVAGGRPPLRRFRAQGEPVGRFLDGSLGAMELWRSYIAEQTQRKDVTRLDLSSEP